MTTNDSIYGLPLLSVALPVLNGGKFLKSAVQSILNQKFTSWELLILDGGSTDNALNELYDLSDSRIKIIRDGAHRGLAGRLNQAIAMAKGKYFARMDHDDFSYPDRFMKQVQFLEEHSHIDLLATLCVVIDENDQLLGTLPFAANHQEICHSPWRGFYMPHPTWMGKIDWFRHHLYKDPAPYCCEDQELLLRSYATSSFHALFEPLLAYRIYKQVPLLERVRIRLAMGHMQFSHFKHYDQWLYAILCWLATQFRILIDFCNYLILLFLPKKNFHPIKKLPLDENLAWTAAFQSSKKTLE